MKDLSTGSFPKAPSIFKFTRFRLLFKHQRIARNFTVLMIFVFVFVFALFRCWIAFTTGQYGVNTSMQFLQARHTLAGLDAGSYLQGAISLHDSSFRNSANQFIWQLWPPGLPLYEALLIFVFGLGAKPLVLLSVTAALLLATSTMLLWIESIKLRRKRFSLILLLVLLLSSVVQGWLLDQGIMYAEGIFVFLLILSSISLARFESTGKTRFFYESSFLVGLAAYFRAVGFTCIEVIFLAALLVSGIGFVLKFRKPHPARRVLRLALDLFKYGGVAFAVTLPWSLFRASWLKLNPVQWVITGDSTWKLAWQSDADLDKSGWGITKGIDNWACHLDQIKCKILSTTKNPQYFSDSIRVIFRHPIEFLWMRATAFWDYWTLNGRWLYPPQNRLPVAFAYFEGSVFLLLVIAALFLLLTSLTRYPYFSIITLSLILGSTLPLFVFHLESRYFIPLKILAIIVVILHPSSIVNLKKLKFFFSGRMTFLPGRFKSG